MKVGDTVLINPDCAYLEHRGKTATILEIRTDYSESDLFAEDEAPVFYRLDLEDTDHGSYYCNYEVKNAGVVVKEVLQNG